MLRNSDSPEYKGVVLPGKEFPQNVMLRRIFFKTASDRLVPVIPAEKNPGLRWSCYLTSILRGTFFGYPGAWIFYLSTHNITIDMVFYNYTFYNEILQTYSAQKFK